MASGSQNMTTFKAKGLTSIANAVDTSNFIFLKSTTLTADQLGNTVSLSLNAVGVTGAAVTNHSLFLNAGVGSGLGTPFQLQIPDSSHLYIYKRWYTSGAWSGWSKICAGTADTWTTARTLTIGATGKSVNGSVNVSWSKDEILGSSTSAYFLRGDKAWSNTLTGEYITTSANGYRIKYGSYGVFLRNDGSDTYILLTASGDQGGNWNSLRPFRINNASGKLYSSNGQLFEGNTTFNGIAYFANGTTYYINNSGTAKLNDATIAGTLYLTRTTDAEATADNRPALLIGPYNGAHLEFDGNEIMAKGSATTTSTLYLNNNGGRTYFGGDISCASTLTVRAENTTTEGGQICLAADPNHSSYAAYLDVCNNYFRIHSNGMSRIEFQLTDGGLITTRSSLKLVKITNTALGIDTSLKIGTTIRDLHLNFAYGGGSGINDGYSSGITWGHSDTAQAGIYCQSSGSYGTRLHFATTNSYADGAYSRMMIAHDGRIGINTVDPDASSKLHIVGSFADSHGLLKLEDTRTDGGWHYPILAISPNLAAGTNIYLCIGKAATTGQAAGLRYYFAGNSSNDNLMGFEFYGQGTPFYVKPNGYAYISSHLSCGYDNTGYSVSVNTLIANDHVYSRNALYTNGNLNMMYNNTWYATVANYNNANITLNACGGTLHVGYSNTASVWFGSNGTEKAVLDANHLYIYSRNPVADPHSGAAIEVREVAMCGTSQDSEAYCPRIGFHWGGRVAAWLGLLSDGWFKLGRENNAYYGIRTGSHVINGTTQSTGRIYANEWIQFDNWTGLYSPNNGAHFYPNNISTYGAWVARGSRGGYYGIHLGDSAGLMTLMCDGNGNGGLFHESSNWSVYYYQDGGRLGLRGSDTSSGYSVQVNGSLYITSTTYSAGDTYSAGNIHCNGSLYVSKNNATGGGIILANDGDIVDLNDAYCAMRFTSGIRIYSANRGGSVVYTLGSNGWMTGSGGQIYWNGNFHLDALSSYHMYLNYHNPTQNIYFGNQGYCIYNNGANYNGNAASATGAQYSGYTYNLFPYAGNECTVGSSVGAANGDIWINYRSAQNGTTNDASAQISSYYFGNRKGAWNSTHIHTGVVHGSVGNDVAEYRESNITEPGRVLIPNGSGKMILCEQRLASGAKIISDTFGCAVGESDLDKTPLGIAGRVLAYTYQNRNNFKPGDCVCAAPGGTIDIMTREEIQLYPDRIIGIVDEIPVYKKWERYNTTYKEGEPPIRSKISDVEIKDRIWVYVR